MRSRVAIIYNEPAPSRYDAIGESAAERGVMDAVTAVHQALIELGYDVVMVPLTPPLEQAREKLKLIGADLAFNLFEGFGGQPETEAELPGILTEFGISYTGCPASVLRLALDKPKTKAVLQAAGISTPRYQILTSQTLSRFRLRYPCIVKPCKDDASHGISATSVVNNTSQLEKQVELVSNAYGEALVEEFLDGREFNATVLGNTECTVLPASEIVYSLPPDMPRILTFAAKWEPASPYFEGTKAICPAQIPASINEQINKIVLAVFRLLGCQGYARVDMRLDQKEQVNVIEVNPNPDISPDTGAARQAKAAGMTYAQFIEKIILLAREGNKNASQAASHDKKRQARPDENPGEYTRIHAT